MTIDGGQRPNPATLKNYIVLYAAGSRGDLSDMSIFNSCAGIFKRLSTYLACVTGKRLGQEI
jgi:hypothetical protein